MSNYFCQAIAAECCKQYGEQWTEWDRTAEEVFGSDAYECAADRAPRCHEPRRLYIRG
jgi:hypothetical protein